MMHHVGAVLQDAPVWAYGFTGLMTVIFILSQLAISYTYGSVVATLAIVESPATTAILRTTPGEDEADATLPPYSDVDDTKVDSENADQKQPLLNVVEQEVMLITPKPITASLRGTIRHLRSRGGWLSRFRGAGVAIVFGIFSHLAHSLVMSITTRHPIVRGLSFVFVQVGLCRLNMLWTHVVISEPSSKPWYKRISPRSSARKIMMPTATNAVAQIATAVVPVFVYFAVDAEKYTRKNINELTEGQRLALAAKLLTVGASFVVMVLFVLLPVQVSLTRCQAALLSEEETPIVPFDRSFGGLVVSEAEGGSGKLRMKDAWTSFDWNDRVRLAKVWAKTIVMQVGTTILFTMSIMVFGSAVHFTKRH